MLTLWALGAQGPNRRWKLQRRARKSDHWQRRKARMQRHPRSQMMGTKKVVSVLRSSSKLSAEGRPLCSAFRSGWELPGWSAWQMRGRGSLGSSGRTGIAWVWRFQEFCCRRKNRNRPGPYMLVRRAVPLSLCSVWLCSRNWSRKEMVMLRESVE